MASRIRLQGVWILALLLAALRASLSAADQPVLLGTVIRVVDGDTLKVQLSSGPITVRLDSIDAPETAQPHGPEAKRALESLLSGKEVQLCVVSQDRYERLVAEVFVGDISVNAWLVTNGHAWAYRRYLRDVAYCHMEDLARRKRLGFWALPASDWIYPSDRRRVRRRQLDRPADHTNETAMDCIAAQGSGK